MTQVKERPKSAAKPPRVTDRRRLKKIFTAEDLLHLPEAPDGRRYELVEGKLYEMPPPGPRHGYITSNVAFLIETYVRRHRIGRVMAGDTGFLLGRDPDTVRGPDVAYISYERFPEDRELPDRYEDILPELAVEVVSPSDTRRYVREKAEAWLAAGVAVVWVLDPRIGEVTVYRAGRGTSVFHGEETLDGAPALPGFSCRVADFFA